MLCYNIDICERLCYFSESLSIYESNLLNNSFEAHDHKKCVKTSVKALEEFCGSSGLQYTYLRKRVLEILLEGHKALGAYEILDRLRHDGGRSQPPIAYRALNFLVNNGFAHKIERLNAYIACCVPGRSHKPTFLICRICRGVNETENKSTHYELNAEAKTANFNIENSVVEAIGVCPSCG